MKLKALEAVQPIRLQFDKAAEAGNCAQAEIVILIRDIVLEFGAGAVQGRKKNGKGFVGMNNETQASISEGLRKRGFHFGPGLVGRLWNDRLSQHVRMEKDETHSWASIDPDAFDDVIQGVKDGKLRLKNKAPAPSKGPITCTDVIEDFARGMGKLTKAEQARVITALRTRGFIQ